MGQLAHQLLLTLCPKLDGLDPCWTFIGNTKCGAWGFVAKDDMGKFIAVAGWEAETYPHCAPGWNRNLCSCNRRSSSSRSAPCCFLIWLPDFGECDEEWELRSDMGALIREARSVCIVSSESYEFSYYPCSCYKIAHELAQHGLRANNVCWMGPKGPRFLYLSWWPGRVLSPLVNGFPFSPKKMKLWEQ
jgi:hypothetical protein